MSIVRRRPAADHDLIDSYSYCAREAGRGVADRFFAKVEESSARLARARVIPWPSTSISTLRYFPVTGFRAYVIFYRPMTDGIEVFRVLHGARDIDSILADVFDLQGE
jgi:toxin ParE1/3/4